MIFLNDFSLLFFEHQYLIQYLNHVNEILHRP